MALGHDQARPELFFVRKDGEIVAGAIVFKGGDRAVYLYGATLDKALPLRAGYFLHWHIARWLRDNTQAEWYDLGRDRRLSGLHQFKKGLVGQRRRHFARAARGQLCGQQARIPCRHSALWARERPA
jgi:lipid II:glycine glycyltransferase (peptidoglycan interpeptide bridge formation enzyme)